MTSIHFVFVRAMNTGGRRLTNEQQLEPFRVAGYDASAYQAAGNIVVRSQDPVTSEVLDPLLSAAYGFDAPTFVRTASQLREVVGHRAFGDDRIAATAGRIQVAFLASRPGADDVARAMESVPGDDSVVVHGSEWYWLPVGGISGSSLPVPTIERILGPMTIRTLGTLERMSKKFG